MLDQDQEIMQAHCPQCGPNRHSDIIALHRDSFNDEESGVWGGTDYRILKCRGCGSVFFQTSSYFSEHMDYKENPYTGELEPYFPEKITYWPSPAKRDLPNWFDDIMLDNARIGDLLEDVYGALNADLRVPAAVATRTVFDAASEELNIDPGLSFSRKLNELLKNGNISADEKASLEILVDAGSAAAHRGWRPSLAELDSMVSILEAFIHRTFILGKKAQTLKSRIPQRNP